MKEIVLFNDKKDCCACGACVNICPKNAISMAEDECGFLYPRIDRELCVGCGACKKVCSFQNKEETNTPLKTYAAVSENSGQRALSSSGGLFPAIAEKVLGENGVVFGSAYDENFNVSHIAVEKKEDLKKLQGSKYVFSSTKDTYKLVKEYLESGKTVLYSGVPCQIAGLYGYLGKSFEKLFTVDIVCHGVPSHKMFSEFLSSLEKENNGKLKSFTFRDKSIGWGINGSAVFKSGNNSKKVKLWCSANPYFYYFTQALIYRENCYSCKYACENRPADITLGDFWGIEKQHPDYLKKPGWNEKGGISVVVANTEKGEKIISDVKGIELLESEFKNASAANPQLRRPSDRGARDEIMKTYAEGGWRAVENRYNSKIGFRKHSSRIKSMLPVCVKRFLKKLK